ncbi:MAG: hypothetical protein MZW92_20910 [Comamonadaceae bacterium]|nr:hypothetical protein [Comamonadaceae bacterium]
MLNTIKARLIAISVLIVVAAIGVATLASYLSVRGHAEASGADAALRIWARPMPQRWGPGSRRRRTSSRR